MSKKQGFPFDDQEMRCTFCGKSRSQVNKLIQGPDGVCICDECVRTCSDMINDSFELELEEAERSDAATDARRHARGARAFLFPLTPQERFVT